MRAMPPALPVRAGRLRLNRRRRLGPVHTNYANRVIILGWRSRKPNTLALPRTFRCNAATSAEPAGAQRHPVRGGAWLQMARLAQSLRQLAHHLHAHEPLVEERRPRPGRTAATRTVCASSSKRCRDDHQGHRDWGAKKNAAAIGSQAAGPPMVRMPGRTFSLADSAHDEGRKCRARNRTSPVHGPRVRRHETRQLALDLASHPWFRRSRPGATPGYTTGRCTGGATKSSAVPTPQGLPPNLLSLREARRDLPVHPLRARDALR